MTAPLTRAPRPTVPAPHPATPSPSSPTADTCGMCNGQKGHWETADGASPGKAIRRWVPCAGCNGRGTV